MGNEFHKLFVSVVDFDLDLLVLKLPFFLCGGSKLVVCGPKLTCFYCIDRLPCFFVMVFQIGLVFRWGP